MYYKLHRAFLTAGLCMNAVAILLRYQIPAQDFWIGVCEGSSISLLLGCLYFLFRARKAGEPQADSRLCRWKRGRIEKLRRGGRVEQ